MKTVSELAMEFSTLKSKRIPRAEKIPVARGIRESVGEIERAAMKDFSFPLHEIRNAKEFIQQLDEYLR